MQFRRIKKTSLNLYRIYLVETEKWFDGPTQIDFGNDDDEIGNEGIHRMH